MRKQYHFRRSGADTLIWDVDRLVELSRDLPRVRVPLDEIQELDEAYWGDEGTSLTCREVVDHMRLTREADLAYPIILCADGRVMDGMHRVARALLQERDEIEAVRFTETPTHDFENLDPDDLEY